MSIHEAAGTAASMPSAFPRSLAKARQVSQPARRPRNSEGRPHQLSSDRQRDTDASAIAKHFANAAPRAIHTPSLLPTRLRAPALPPANTPRYVSATALCAPITALCALGFTGRRKLRTTPGSSPRLWLRATGCHTRWPFRGACDYTFHVFCAIIRGWREQDG